MSTRGVAAGWRLERRPDGGVDFVTADGRRHNDVDVRRGFPFSAPEGGVAVLATDGAELAWIDSLAACDRTLATLLEAILAEREFMPRVERIVSVSEGRPTEWNVVTDRGPHRFSVAHPDDVSRQPDGGAILTDTDGIRYRVPPAAALDSHSRRLLERGL
jgi:hypothetical protein